MVSQCFCFYSPKVGHYLGQLSVKEYVWDKEWHKCSHMNIRTAPQGLFLEKATERLHMTRFISNQKLTD